VLFYSPPWASIVYWSLDIETGGLDPRRDPIIAVGMVSLRDGILRLGESYQTLIRPEDGREIRPDSVMAHQLVTGEVRQAPPLVEALEQVARRIREGALLVHHQSIDVAFLRQAFERHGLVWPRPPVVDTVELLHKLARKQRFVNPDLPDDAPNTKLGDARQAHGLPEYQAHDALTDAIATGELFLVLRRKLNARTLRDL